MKPAARTIQLPRFEITAHYGAEDKEPFRVITFDQVSHKRLIDHLTSKGFSPIVTVTGTTTPYTTNH